MKISFVTSSENKREELAQTLGTDYEVIRIQADLPEIQSLDAREIIKEKLKAAKSLFPSQLIIVEDTSFEVDSMGGLPGPFIKFFEQQVDDQGIYEMARGRQPDGALTGRAKVIIGLLHGDEIEYFEGSIDGTIVEQSGEGWGFDRIFVPTGHQERMGALGLEVKTKISHRALAVHALKKYLDNLEDI